MSPGMAMDERGIHMNKFSSGEAANLSASQPADQNARLGERVREIDSYGTFQIVTAFPAGTTGSIVPAAIDSDQSLVFDFEILDVTVRTDTTVASSTVQVKNNTTAVTDAIVSATAKAITRVGTIDVAQNKFYPKSNPAGYAAAKCNLVDAGGTTAPARTVILWVRKI